MRSAIASFEELPTEPKPGLRSLQPGSKWVSVA